MSTYCIGDIQGCFDELRELLQLIKFDSQKDQLWFVGDLVNRGPKSLETLRFIKNLGNTKVVLGNHDLHLLAVANNKTNVELEHSLHDILAAPDKQELLEWLRMRPLLHHDEKLNYVLVHAGIYPLWDLATAKSCALEVERVLSGDNYQELLAHMYGNEPAKWHDNLQGWDRLRFIINAFTRMRFCDREGHLDLICRGKIGTQPKGFMPWYEVPNRPAQNVKILFGHWAALEGKAPHSANVYALDTGCMWGGNLTAMRLCDQVMFQVKCLTYKKPTGI